MTKYHRQDVCIYVYVCLNERTSVCGVGCSQSAEPASAAQLSHSQSFLPLCHISYIVPHCLSRHGASVRTFLVAGDIYIDVRIKSNQIYQSIKWRYI